MSTHQSQLWARLRDAGIVEGDAPEPVTELPWHVRAMIGVAAWLAALLLLMFAGLGLAFLFRERVAGLVIGCLVCAAAIALLRVAGRHPFPHQFALAASLAGQGLVVAALLRGSTDFLGPGMAQPLLWCALFEFVLVALAPDYVHRLLSALAALVALRLAMEPAGLAPLAPSLAMALFVGVQANDVRLASRVSLWQPVAMALALNALLITASGFADWESWLVPGRIDSTTLRALDAAILGAIFIGVLLHFMKTTGVRLASVRGLQIIVVSALVSAAAWPMPGLIVGLIVLLMGFAASHRAMLGIGIATLLLALGHYYYSLQTTLLVKSAALFGVGAILLIARMFVRFPRAPQEVPDA